MTRQSSLWTTIRIRQLAWCSLVLTSLLQGALALAQSPAPLLRPSGQVWDAGAGFAFALKDKKARKIRRSLSGIACNLNTTGERVCLMAFDEGTQARYATLRPNQLVPDAHPVVLTVGQGELDAEGAATDGHYIYVTGSHSTKRSDCSSNPNSRQVLRLTVDPATARGRPESLRESSRLWQVMATIPALKDHVGERQCLGSEPGQLGINIEGLAVHDDLLYFGFRGPVIDGEAWVLSVDAAALFGGADPTPQLSRLALGAHRGIRDMVAVKDGFLLLAGPDDGKTQGVAWTISLWDGKNSGPLATPRLLATLDLSAVALRACDVDLKPEAITVLAEGAQSYQVLVLSDGMCDGGPLLFTVPH
jgi:hypothetical protein